MTAFHFFLLLCHYYFEYNNWVHCIDRSNGIIMFSFLPNNHGSHGSVTILIFGLGLSFTDLSVSKVPRTVGGPCQILHCMHWKKNLPSNWDISITCHQISAAHDVENYRLSSNINIRLNQRASLSSNITFWQCGKMSLVLHYAHRRSLFIIYFNCFNFDVSELCSGNRFYTSAQQ